MNTLAHSSGGVGVVLVGALALIVVGLASAPLQAPQRIGDFTTANAVAQISDVDALEEGEPMAAEAVGVTTLGPHADEAYNIPGLGDVLAGQHAEERHGIEACQARLAMMTGGYQRFDCKDGRTRLVKQLARSAWAIVVVEAGIEISAFISERPAQAISRVLERDGCLPPGSPFGGALAN